MSTDTYMEHSRLYSPPIPHDKTEDEQYATDVHKRETFVPNLGMAKISVIQKQYWKKCAKAINVCSYSILQS